MVEEEHETLMDERVSDPSVTLTNIFSDANCPAMVIVNWLRVSAVLVNVNIDAVMVDSLSNDTVALSDAVQDVRRREDCVEEVPVRERPVFPDECVSFDVRMIAVDGVKVVLVNAPMRVSHGSDASPHPISSDTPLWTT